MRSIIICFLICNFTFANNLEILQNDKKELRNLEKKSIEASYEALKNEWISPITISSGLQRDHSFSSQSGSFDKSATIGFTQSIYESGGIELKIQYAKDKYKTDLISWENDNYQLLQTIYETLLEISKIKLEIEQSAYKLQNKEIEMILKKIQYEAGDVDIVDLNNSIIAKNSQFKENILLQNSLKDKEYELSKYTNLKYNEIEILDFSGIKKEDFIDKNIALLLQKSKIDMLGTSYEQTKTSYLPKVTTSLKANYLDSEDFYSSTQKETNNTGIASVNLSIPLYDYNKSNKVEESKINYLKQKAQVNDLKNQLAYEYEQILNQIDIYEKYNKTIKDSIKLYDDLLLVNNISNSAGMTSTYDLDILKNTKKINEYDLVINDINIKLQHSKLYFKTKGDN